MRTHIYIVLAAVMALPLLTRAEDAVVSDTLEVTMDSVVVAEDSVPDWYVEPVIPAELRAPMRANAVGCLTDSVLTFNIDSVLTEATIYDYDASGRTIRTTVWTYLADGSRIGKSKQEYAFDASGTQIYTGTFAWDATTNDWRGTSKSEYVYNESHKMESQVYYTWVNQAWLPQTAYTYVYDAAGRQTEYTTYTRNESANCLVPYKCYIQVWYDNSKKTLEINYTAYTNNAWSAGTKKEYRYDTNGNKVEYTYYNSLSDGSWVGYTHEIWQFNANNYQTFYKREMWVNGSWVVYSEEFTGYDTAGNNVLVENYTYTNGVQKGSKKETYTYNTKKKKTGTITYRWTNNEWVNNVWTVTGYDDMGNSNESCKYNWINGAWVGTGTRTLRTYNSSKQVIEQISQTWPSGANDWVNSTRATTTYSGAKITQEASYIWQNEAWVGTTRSDWHYNAAGQNDTIKTYTNNGTDWIYSNRTVNTYNSKGENILTHNATWNGTIWVMTSMNRLDVEYNEVGSILFSATYTCTYDSVWRGSDKMECFYNDRNLLIQSYTYLWEIDNWIYKSRNIFDYDNSNRKTLDERYRFEGGNWIGDSKKVSEWDLTGRLILSEDYDWNNNAWYGKTKYSYSYDNGGNKLEDWIYRWQDTIWIPSLSHVYTYDTQNHIIQDILSSRNASNIFEFEKKNEYIYGANNLLLLSNEYSWNGTYWDLRSLNENSYDSIDYKLRKELRATYNNGISLTYTNLHYFYSCDTPTGNNGTQPRTPTGTDEEAVNPERILDNNNKNTLITTQPVYNLQGQSVDPTTYHGVVIQGGKTYLIP